MRYSGKRLWRHPVLRPGTDDYPNAEDAGPDVPRPKSVPGGKIEISIHWKPSPRTIREKMRSGEAALCALVYCAGTYFRTTIEGNRSSPFQATERIDVQEVKGRIEIHPFIVAKERLTLNPSELHHEYHGALVSLRPGEPLAVHPRFDTDCEATKPAVESFVQLQEDETVEEGRIEVICELGRPEIAIRLHPDTYRGLNAARKSAKARAGVYLPALLKACCEIANAGAAEDPETGDDEVKSWNAVIDRMLAKGDAEAGYGPCYIERVGDRNLPSREFDKGLEEIKPEEAAQRLLASPIGEMLEEGKPVDFEGQDE